MAKKSANGKAAPITPPAGSALVIECEGEVIFAAPTRRERQPIAIGDADRERIMRAARKPVRLAKGAEARWAEGIRAALAVFRHQLAQADERPTEDEWTKALAAARRLGDALRPILSKSGEWGQTPLPNAFSDAWAAADFIKRHPLAPRPKWTPRKQRSDAVGFFIAEMREAYQAAFGAKAAASTSPDGGPFHRFVLACVETVPELRGAVSVATINRYVAQPLNGARKQSAKPMREPSKIFDPRA